jgi:hypothetical protein
MNNGAITKMRYNRFAYHRLSRKFSYDEIEAMLMFAVEIRTMPYAPTVYNFMDLEEKWQKLLDFAVRNKLQQQVKSKGSFYEEL